MLLLLALSLSPAELLNGASHIVHTSGAVGERSTLDIDQWRFEALDLAASNTTVNTITVSKALSLPKIPSRPDSSFCGGTTKRGKTKWFSYGTAGLSAQIDTSGCKFSKDAVYLASVVGDSRHWDLTGTNCVYDSSHESFRLFVYHPSMRREKLLGHAKRFWTISWVASTSAKHSGTAIGGPKWKKFGSHSLFLDVDTSTAGFPGTPNYITAMNGEHSHWRTVGSHAIYEPSATSFRIYVLYELSEVKVSQASKWQWAINWMGSTESYSGVSSGNWNNVELKEDRAAYIDVDASASGFQAAPSFVTSYVVKATHQWVVGGSNLYNPSATGFRTYVDRIMDTRQLSASWRVNYIGYEGPQDCDVTSWGKFGSCSKTCGGGVRIAFRKVLQPMYLGGTPCPALNKTKLCHTEHCPVHCNISAWSPWSSCSKSCAYGTKKRGRKITVMPNYGGVPCPKLAETRGCNLFPCAGTGTSTPCGATTISGKTEWKIQDELGMYTEIDTSACKFKQTLNGYAFVPYYTASVMGHAPKFTSASTIFSATATHFRIYVWHPELSGKKLWFFATKYKWVVSWIGDTGSNCGRTTEGLTGWKELPSSPHSLFVDVNTQASKFKATPTYVPSLVAGDKPVQAIGVHNVFKATSTGFRIYVAFPQKVSAALAEQKQWTLNWMGSHSIMSGVSPKASVWQDAVAESSSASLNKAIFMHVDSSANYFPRVPNYVVAVTGMNAPKGWDPYGGGSIYNASSTGFDLYFWNSGQGAAFANKNGWKINYLGYTTPTNCKIGDWGQYSTCTKSCANGTKHRSRTVLVHPYGGVPCPKLAQNTTCNVQACPIDCAVSPWTEWAECSLTCGGGSTLKTRKITKDAENGGSVCPALKKDKPCNTDPCPIDCSISGWTSWSQCDEKCGVNGTRDRQRSITKFPKYGGELCPLLNETLPCNHLPCVGEGTGPICGGKTSADWQSWKMFGSTGLYLDIDTSKCKFTATPNYVANVVGDKKHWQMSGVNSIYSASKDAFRMYLWHPTLYSTNLKSIAIQYNWNVNWLADPGRKSGVTTAGKTDWKQMKRNLIYVDVDTINSKYPVTPRYVTSIHGTRDHWKVQGAHSVYNPESDGFRVYLLYPDITVAEAEKKQWTIAWIGSYDDSNSGQSSSVWTPYKKDGTGDISALYIDVDASKSKFHGVPAYVSCVAGDSHHWGVTGAASMYSPTRTGFRVYLDKALSADFAHRKKWHVNYIAYQGSIDCQVSSWSTWSKCPGSCVPTNQYRIRKILKKAFNGGNCTKLKDTRACNEHGCPVNCKLSDWGAWSVCSKSCDAGKQTRLRNILVHAAFAGDACPDLTADRSCNTAACNSAEAEAALKAAAQPDCSEKNVFGDWSECTKFCGSGYRFRYREHIMCSVHTHFVPYKMKFRQKMHCNVAPCKSATEMHQVRNVVVPAVSGNAGDAEDGGDEPAGGK